MEKAREILSMKNITKVYGNGVLANSHVDFSINKGEIHALMGGKRSRKINTYEDSVWNPATG